MFISIGRNPIHRLYLYNKTDKCVIHRRVNLIDEMINPISSEDASICKKNLHIILRLEQFGIDAGYPWTACHFEEILFRHAASNNMSGWCMFFFSWCMPITRGSLAERQYEITWQK